MRICLVSQEYPPETARGGIGSQTYLKAHGLAARGHEVHVISRSTQGGVREVRDGAVRVIRLPGFEQELPHQTEPVQWLTYSTRVAAAVWQLHARAPLDLIDFPEWGGEAYVHLLNRAPWYDIRTVIQLHGPLVMFADRLGWPDPASEFYRTGTAIEAACLRLADAVFSSSRCSIRWCAEFYGLDPERTPVLHTGIDTELFRPADVPKASRPTILFAGRIARNKGVELLLDATCRLAGEFPDVQLRMLGRSDGTLADQLLDRARSRGLAGLLEVPGFVDRGELPIELSRAHVFAAPSAYEGGPGFVYLEAMACGLPVIACEGSGASEAVLAGETGLLVPPGDVEALTASLRRLLSDAGARQEMGRRAVQHVRREFDSRACLDRLEAFYGSVAERENIDAG